MKKIWPTIFTLLLSSTSFAERWSNQVHSVLMGKKDEFHIVRLQDGRVIYLDADKKELAQNLMTKARPILSEKLLLEEPPLPSDNYEPTVLPNLGAAQELFDRLNSKYQRVSQCFNRAHIWSNEEFKNNNVKSMKTYVFFTENYLRTFRFTWWFHVAPTILVQEGSEKVMRVLDYRYGMKPQTVKEWTDLFVYSKRPCPEIPKLSMYHVNPQTEHCYMMKTSMYYYQPADLDNLESTGILKTDFKKSEISWAYSEAF